MQIDKVSRHVNCRYLTLTFPNSLVSNCETIRHKTAFGRAGILPDDLLIGSESCRPDRKGLNKRDLVWRQGVAAVEHANQEVFAEHRGPFLTRSGIEFQRLVPRLVVPDDLPQVSSIYNFAACRTQIEMIALMLDLFIMSLAGNGLLV
jgi:hypothetical protein